MANTNNIFFHFLTEPFHFPNRNKLKQFIHKLISLEGRSIETINYIFCTDEYLLDINKTHLNHDTYTDIITFELSPKKAPLLSDIYISIDRIRENAQTFNSSIQRELHRVIFHGALHLSGYKDKTREQAQLMRKMEDRYLNLYFGPRL